MLLYDHMVDIKSKAEFTKPLHDLQASFDVTDYLDLMTVVKIDNIFKYHVETLLDDKYVYIKDVPGIAPQFDYTWFEFEYGKRIVGLPTRSAKISNYYYGVDGVHGIPYTGNGEYHFYSETTLLLRDERGDIIHYDCSLCVVSDMNGNVIIAKYLSHEGLKENFEFFRELFISAYLAIAFMNCKNVELVKSPILKATKKRKRGPVRIRFYTLAINPVKRILASEGRISENGLKRALHICRGHFKDYRDKGLFGKNKGLYWWDSHARGSVDNGVVVKDYKVNPPKQDQTNS